MLYTRNAYLFRKFYKEEVAREKSRLDLNFVGSLHPDKSRSESGFSKLIYGNREDIGKLLGTIALNVAADDQAIYELIQNADDCKSSFFSVSYNEDYLLCINNGNYFSDEDMSAIINVAGNFKDGEDIGTFGIGFKILHRLVGIDDGRDAIINNYAGPIIFSWNKLIQLNKFLNGDEIKVGFDPEKDNDNAWLVKLLYTCFPSHLGEKIRLQDYDTQDVKFTESELVEMRDFLKISLHNVNLAETNYLKNGSIFFLKLGKGKSKFLDDGIDKIKSGLSYSFKFLNNLGKIYINGEEIKSQKVADYSNSFIIDSPEFIAINPKNKKRDIKFTFAFYTDYKKADTLRNELIPNLFTFFSMDEEKNGFSFLLHCNAFDMNNDRRKLQANSQINEKLLPTIATDIIKYLDSQKETDRYLYISLYSNLLLSKEPKGKPHLNNSFFKFFKEYIANNIPTSKGYSTNAQFVKIKNTFLKINPADIGCPEIDWFYWYNEKIDEVIIKESQLSEKLGLEKWDIIDLFKYSAQHNKVLEINAWIKQLEYETSQIFAEEREIRNNTSSDDMVKRNKPYFSLLSEINKNILKSNLEYISIIKLFKFSDGDFYSLNDIFSNENLILNYDKTFDIRFELQAIGLNSSFINIDKYSNIKELIAGNLDDLNVFQKISNKIKDNHLKQVQKRKLFLALENFNGVGIEKLKDLELFKDSKWNIRPLRYLLKADMQAPNWLYSFKINNAEYFPELEKYLVKEGDVYKEIILSNWDSIISEIANIKEFYSKVKYYYQLNEQNTPLKTQKFIYINSEIGFLSPNDDVFYNFKLNSLNGHYSYFQTAIFNLCKSLIPDQKVISFLSDYPFKVDNLNVLDKQFIDCDLSTNELKSILSFCKLNNESFFKNRLIKRNTTGFTIVSKTNSIFQISSPDKDARLFIDEYCTDKLYVLPNEFSEYKDEDGIVRADDLHSLLLDCVNVDEHKESLVDIVKYKAKYQLLIKLSGFSFNTDKKYTKDDYEFKILELACAELKENDYSKFKDKVQIIKNSKPIALSDIPPFANNINIGGTELNLSEVLPDNYQNSSYLSALIDNFVSLGLSKEKLFLLFGVKSEPNPEYIFDLLSDKHSLLETSQQLVFVLLYNKFCEAIDLKKFEVICSAGDKYNLTYDFYTTQLDFLNKNAALHSSYSGIKKLLKELPFAISEENMILEEPYFEDDKFICPDILTENLSVNQKTSLINFIFDLWNKKNKKTVIRNINWSKINNTETESLLDFNPQYTVYPNKYAYDSEKLPDYLIEWINDDNNKISFLSDLGVWVENSIVVDLRKFLSGELKEFSNNRLAQEVRFNNDEKMLFNSFEWLKENEIQLSTNEQYETFKKVVEIINENRSGGDLICDEKFDFEILAENSIEWDESIYQIWKEKLDINFTIYLFEEELPQKVDLDEIKDYIFYRFNGNDSVIDDENNIYINRKADLKKELQKLASNDDNNFNFEHLWDIFGNNNDETNELRNRIAQLESQLKQKPDADLGVGFDNSISRNDQIETNREAKEIVKERLQSEGYNFTKGIGEYSTIDGVIKDDIEFPIVVKSYKWRDEPLKIGANEWLQLMKPNSMFWVHFGNRKLGCLKLYELLKRQDKLTLSFSTENLDYDNRLYKFAELLHYFGNVHFDFNNVKADNFSTAESLKDYRFDERKTEQDLSGDNDKLL